jgi:hypothetical protein
MGEQERPTSELRVPAGIDYLLSLGARDPRFREHLLNDPFAAARRAGLRLTGSERAILSALPREQLRAVIDTATPRTAARRGFLQRAALWVVGLFGGVTMTTMTGCSHPVPTGEAPDVPPPRDEPRRDRENAPRPQAASDDEAAAEDVTGPAKPTRPHVPQSKDD